MKCINKINIIHIFLFTIKCVIDLAYHTTHAAKQNTAM